MKFKKFKWAIFDGIISIAAALNLFLVHRIFFYQVNIKHFNIHFEIPVFISRQSWNAIVAEISRPFGYVEQFIDQINGFFSNNVPKLNSIQNSVNSIIEKLDQIINAEGFWGKVAATVNSVSVANEALTTANSVVEIVDDTTATFDKLQTTYNSFTESLNVTSEQLDKMIAKGEGLSYFTLFDVGLGIISASVLAVIALVFLIRAFINVNNNYEKSVNISRKCLLALTFAHGIQVAYVFLFNFVFSISDAGYLSLARLNSPSVSMIFLIICIVLLIVQKKIEPALLNNVNTSVKYTSEPIVNEADDNISEQVPVFAGAITTDNENNGYKSEYAEPIFNETDDIIPESVPAFTDVVTTNNENNERPPMKISNAEIIPQNKAVEISVPLWYCVQCGSGNIMSNIYCTNCGNKNSKVHFNISEKAKIIADKAKNIADKAKNTAASIPKPKIDINGAINKIKDTASSISSSTANTNSSFEKIKKLKELLDMGAITQEEFEQKKKEILKLDK